MRRDMRLKHFQPESQRIKDNLGHACCWAWRVRLSKVFREVKMISQAQVHPVYPLVFFFADSESTMTRGRKRKHSRESCFSCKFSKQAKYSPYSWKVRGPLTWWFLLQVGDEKFAQTHEIRNRVSKKYTCNSTSTSYDARPLRCVPLNREPAYNPLSANDSSETDGIHLI
jgi:hypothetical protein